MVRCESLDSYISGLKTFRSHFHAVEDLHKLIAVQQGSIAVVVQTMNIRGKEDPRLEIEKLRDIVDGWLEEFKGIKVEIARKGILCDFGDLDLVD